MKLLIRHPIIIAFFALCVIAQTAAWVSGQTAVQWQAVISTLNDIQTSIGVMQQEIAALQATPPSGGTGTVVSVAGSPPLSVTGTATVNPTVGISGSGSFTTNGLLFSNGTSLATTTQGTAGQFAAGAGAGPPVMRAIMQSDLTFLGALGTLGVGTGLTSSGGNLNANVPWSVANGGTQCGAPTTVANLPGSPTQGEICNVTNDTTGCVAGTAVVNGGATKCQVTWNGTSWLPAGGATSAASGGVTTVTGTAPIVSSGGASPAISLTGAASASANTIFAGPSSGAAANAAFRAAVPADIPGVTVTVANASSTGTTVNTLTKLTGAPSTAVITASADTAGAIGVCIVGCGTTGSAIIQTQGLVTLAIDNGTTAGDWIQMSSSTGGDGHDTGVAPPNYPTVFGQVIGRVTTTNASAGNDTVNLGLDAGLTGSNASLVAGANITIGGQFPAQTVTAFPIHEHTLTESAGAATMTINNATQPAIDDEIVALNANITITTDTAAHMTTGEIVHVHATTSGTAWTVAFAAGVGVTLDDDVSGSNGTVGSACQPTASDSTDYWFWWDGANLILFSCAPYANACAGTKQLSSGSATISSSCFTAATNRVTCSEITAPNPVSCTPSNGSLTITGSGSDSISWARAF